MKYRLWKKITTICLTLALLLEPLGAKAVQAADKSDPDSRITAAAAAAISWSRDGRKKLLDGDFTDHMGEPLYDWLALSFGRWGIKEDYEKALTALENDVTEAYKTERKLGGNKSTEWHRIALTVLALGGDPTNFGKNEDGTSVNLIADGVYDRGLTASFDDQGNNAWIWALITLDAMRYEVPEGSSYTREDLLEGILKAQDESGGFVLMPGAPDVDMTGMALQALAPYYQDDTVVRVTEDGVETEVGVKDAVDRGLAWLSDNQQSDGGYVSYGTENTESTAQVITALAALNLDALSDERFIKDGHTLLDALLGFQQENGSFVHAWDGNGEDVMATEQSLYALCALYRQRHGYRSLYDFRPEEGAQESYTSGKGTVTELLPALNRTPVNTTLVAGISGVVGILAVITILTVLHKKKRKKVKEELKHEEW